MRELCKDLMRRVRLTQVGLRRRCLAGARRYWS